MFAYDCFDSTRACTYDQLRTLLNDDLGGVDASTRVAIAMRNGADLALALLRVMHWAIAVPLCPNSSPAELRAAMEGCAYCIVDATDGPPTAAAAAAAAAGASVVVAEPKSGRGGRSIPNRGGGGPAAADAGLLAPAHVLVKSHALGEVHVGAAALSCFADVGHDGPTEARVQDAAAIVKRRRHHREDARARTLGLLASCVEK